MYSHRKREEPKNREQRHSVATLLRHTSGKGGSYEVPLLVCTAQRVPMGEMNHGF